MDELIKAINECSPSSRRSLIRGFWRNLVSDARALSHGPLRNLGVSKAIQNSTVLLVPFAKVSQAIASSAPDDIRNFYEGFVNLVPDSQVWSDIQNFIGHELFTIFVAQLVLEKHWELLNELLSEPLGYETGRERRPISFTRLSKGMPSLEQAKMERLSPRYDVIKELHSKDELGELVPLVDFQAADFLLYLREPYRGSSYSGWRPWSCSFLRQAPDFLAKARSQRSAEAISPAVGVSSRSIDELRSHMGARLKDLVQLFGACFEDIEPIHIFDPGVIGTSP